MFDGMYTSFAEYLREQTTSGSYIGAHFTESSNQRLDEFIRRHNIPVTKKVPWHITVIYSKTPISAEIARGDLDPPAQVKPIRLEKWDTQDEKVALVLIVQAPEFIQRHNHIMETTGASYDYDEYKPHITMSYDVPRDFELKGKDPESIGMLFANEEYYESLKLDWQNN